MDANHPFSPNTAFPLSFFEEDMVLFGGGTPSTGHNGSSAADFAAAWADMGMGQGRSVSSIMDPYHIDTAGGNGGPGSPSLASPLGGGMGLLSPTAGPAGGVVVRTGSTKKRGTAATTLSGNVDAMGNPLPPPPLPPHMTPSMVEMMLYHNQQHHHPHHPLHNPYHNPYHHPAAAAAAAGVGTPYGYHSSHSHSHSHSPSSMAATPAGITISSNSSNSNFGGSARGGGGGGSGRGRSSSISVFDADMMTNVMMNLEDDDADDHVHTNQTNAKRRRRDTVATNGGGSGESGFSSGDDTGSGRDGRRESLTGDKRPERPRLTEVEKKNNHIASEQKRRMAIRDGFDRLTELVPGIEGQGRSESVVLRKTVDYMRQVVEERRNLIAQVQELGGEVPQDLLLR
ncbi:hypothetical protein H072_3483 [Dactylellina haptotyla CBS 200.50]|uniref:BHLH domain-containing protein n=1 Tax=Dactylellina haptotyla (strain CBS 200.50) TaxID=1284197 RepID=S8AI34_DACHA|nr:hypothetical protein H072_3483 [Dactylellina haptotyla CBS 200.50]